MESETLESIEQRNAVETERRKRDVERIESPAVRSKSATSQTEFGSDTPTATSSNSSTTGRNVDTYA